MADNTWISFKLEIGLVIIDRKSEDLEPVVVDSSQPEVVDDKLLGFNYEVVGNILLVGQVFVGR